MRQFQPPVSFAALGPDRTRRPRPCGPQPDVLCPPMNHRRCAAASSTAPARARRRRPSAGCGQSRQRRPGWSVRRQATEKTCPWEVDERNTQPDRRPRDRGPQRPLRLRGPPDRFRARRARGGGASPSPGPNENGHVVRISWQRSLAPHPPTAPRRPPGPPEASKRPGRGAAGARQPIGASAPPFGQPGPAVSPRPARTAAFTNKPRPALAGRPGRARFLPRGGCRSPITPHCGQPSRSENK